MSACLPTGVVALLIDLDDEGTHASLARERDVVRISEVLLELLGAYQMPATWTSRDPARSVVATKVLRKHGEHEIALFGDASWVSADVPRNRFAIQLGDRLNRAAALGLAISTIAVDSRWCEQFSDLALKQGISAVRHSPNSARLGTPRMLPLGLWSFPLTVELPGASSWWPGGGGTRHARSIVDRAIAAQGLASLVIDAPRLAAHSTAAQRALSRVLRHLERRRSQGAVVVENVEGLVRRLRGLCQGQPSRSILRAAA
jgi:hypothetical protein